MVRDFSRSTLAALARKGIRVCGSTTLPGTGSVEFSGDDVGYVVDDNGTSRVWRFADVITAAR